ncbi:MAG: nitrous oxidase accessory protein, partial [Enterobacterales bacterium]
NQIVDTHQQQGLGGENFIKGGEGKALFIYNAHFNTVKNNLFSKSDIAIHLTAGSEENKIYGNYIVKNKRQVKYVASREVEWSFEEQGNYWSDYQGWDRDFNGIGDEAFEPNDGIDKILWKYPAANVLINSPAIQTLRWVQKKFPVLKSPGIKDSYPLMKNTFQIPVDKDSSENLRSSL